MESNDKVLRELVGKRHLLDLTFRMSKQPLVEAAGLLIAKACAREQPMPMSKKK